MADSINTQALTAAFTFGLVVNAASGAVFLYLKGHASSLLRDGLRLVLVTFLATSALWAQTDFISTLINVNSSTGCQVAIVFASIFDQLARVSLQQAIIWAVDHHGQVPQAESLLTQGAIIMRFILGAVFVGLQRPQLDTVCITTTSLLPFGVVLLAADLAFTTVILIRVISFGLVKDMRQGTATSGRSRAALFTIAGLGIWTAMSAPLMLGIRSADVITRTAIPATGLSILIGVLTLFKDSLVSSKEDSTSRTEDATMRGPHTTRQLQSRDISTSDSTLPPSRYEELKDDALASFRAAAQLQTSQLVTGPGGPPGKLPVIARPYAGQAATGIGGVPVQGQFFPPMRSQTLPVSMEARDMTKRPGMVTRKGTKLTISNPILSEASEQQVMTKIPTIDLATAAQNEKDRAKASHMLGSSVPFVSRTELQPPPIPTKAVKRKSLISSGDAVANSYAGGGGAQAPELSSMEKSMATTSATMLSPGMEELRRRSPRQATNITQPQAANIRRPQTSGSSQPEPQFPTRMSSLQQNRMSSLTKPLPNAPFPPSKVNFSFPVDPRKPVLPLEHESAKQGIRPSRQGPEIPGPKTPSTTNLPPVTPARSGLPSNPRAVRMMVPNMDGVVAQDQTVMFMKSIEYNNPAAVKRVVDSAKDKQSMKSPGRSASMVHRPRPIPRLPSIDRAIFPAEGSPNMHQHKRSLSNGLSRTRTLMMFPAVPNSGKLLALPPLPKSAGILLRAQPDDARSMTWDEKMDMFYPQSGSARSSIAGSMRRRSRSVPDVPIMPMMLSDDKVDMASPRNSIYHTDASARTSAATQSISILLEDFPRPQESIRSSKAKSTDPQSANRELKPKAPKSPTQKTSSKNVADRRSSPILPAEDLSMFSPYSEARSRDDEASTNWGSIHSPGTFVNVQKARAVDVPAVPKLHLLQNGAQVVVGTLPPQGRDEDMGASTVMAETSADNVVIAAEESQAITESEHGWHRRVGEECPSFSDRGQTVRPRKVPPPAPLLLNRTNLVPMAVQAEVSPLESPEHALAMIQEQLRKLEDPGRESASSGQGERMTLLADLETELGQQEHQWQGLRGTLMVRDSQSTLGATPDLDSLLGGASRSFATPVREDYLQAASTKQVSRQLLPEQVAGNTGHPSSQASDPTHGGMSQQALARDQTAYVGSRGDLPTKAANSKEGLQVAGSREPTFSWSKTAPQWTDDAAGSEYDQESRVAHTHPAKTLWCPISSDAAVSGATRAFLWTPAAKPAASEIVPSQIALDTVRRRIDQNLEPLTIESSHLWKKPVSERRFSQHGVWRSTSRPVSGGEDQMQVKPEQEPAMEPVIEQQVNRLATQRPPRKSKRITMLPDILESPKPLDRRGTLGIFQFPWGEMSDMPSVPARPLTMMAMAGTMTTGQGREWTAMGSGNAPGSTSFFEDYEAEEDGDSDYGSYYSESDEDDDDDGFDETVLWEIASLLKPSQERGSSSGLFPAEDAHYQIPQRGEDGATTLYSDEAQGVEFVRRDDPEALRFITTNFASSETNSPKTGLPGLPAVTGTPKARDTPMTAGTPRTPRAASASPRSDGPHATATPMETDQGPGRLHGVMHGFLQGREKPVAQASASAGTDEANLNSATDAARGLSPKAELRQQGSGDGGFGGRGGGVDSISNSDSVLPNRLAALAGAPMTTAPSDHEPSGSPSASPILRNPGPAQTDPHHPQRTLAHDADDAHTPVAAWTLNSVQAKPPPRQVPAHPVSPRVLLPSAEYSANADEDAFIQTSPSADSATLPKFAPSSISHSSSPLSPLSPVSTQNSVPQQQILLRNAHHLSLAGPMAMLWSPPAAPILRPSKGLSQPDASTWNSYLPIDNAARAQARKSELATLQSTALWVQPPPQRAREPSPDGLWTPVSPKELTATLPAMWALPPAIERVSYGLPQPDAELWATYLPVEEETPRVKQREAHPATIKSQAMWTKPSKATIVSGDGPLWTAPKPANGTVDAPLEISSSTPEAVSFGLWAPAPATAEPKEPVGLFSLSHERSDFRTTSLSPAALLMARKPRAPQPPFPDFGFTHLWNQTPLWDAAAAAAAVKMQREIDELVLEGLFSLNHRRTNFRTTSEPPAALVTKSKARISREPLPKLTSDSLWSVRDQSPAVELDWLVISSSKPRTSSVDSSSTDAEFLDATKASTAASSVASSVTFEDASTKPARRLDATPAQWLEALQAAISASKDTATLASKDHVFDSSDFPSSAYQLWSKRDDDMSEEEADGNAMWRPSSSPTNRYLVLTSTPGELDDSQLRASAETLRRGGKLQARPPPPVFHGSSVSAFVPGVSETPRDFSAQGLWTSDPAAVAAATAGATIEEERAWLDKSLRQSMSLVKLW